MNAPHFKVQAMYRRYPAIGRRLALSVCLMLSLLVVSPVSGDEPVDRSVELTHKILPMLREHCLDCHSGAEPDAGLTLDHFDTPLSFLKGRSIWEKAIQKMQIEKMPPPDANHLNPEDRKLLIAWITSTIEEYECGLEPNPGQVTLRRLNAQEYQNTIRDLFKLEDYSPASTFPGDDVGYGFDNIGDVLTLPPLLMEKYFLEAERLSRMLIQTPPPAELFSASRLGRQLQLPGVSSQGTGRLTLTTTSDATFTEQIPWAGVYQLKVSAGGDQVGDEPCLMAICVDGKLVRRISVPNDSQVPIDYSLPLRLKAGDREISVGFVNDFYVEPKDGNSKQDRNLVVHQVELVGRQAAQALRTAELSAYHREIFFTTPKDEQDLPRATRAVIQRLASFAFRRPVANDDLERLVALAGNVQTEGDSFEESIQVALQAILISPKFLFRVEPPAAGLAAEKYRDLDDFELATRLSYFLWSSMPDNELLKLAWESKLRAGDTLERQIARMIQDERSNAFVESFAGQWLTLRKLRDFEPDANQFPQWNEQIRSLAQYETLAFFAGVMRRDMSVLRFLDADFTYLNEQLAKYYGIANVVGPEFRPVSLQGTQRAGLLTQVSVLAVTSNPTRTSPVKRGKWILDNLLATPPPPAPPGVPELKERGELSGTLRQRLEQHRADPACASCHKLMDPLGFALENFDAVGQFRLKDDHLDIDATGELPDGTRIQGAFELQKILIEQHRDQFVRCLTEKMLTYALGRGLEYYDKCAVDKIVDALGENDFRFSTLLLEIVRCDAFQKKGERESQ